MKKNLLLLALLGFVLFFNTPLSAQKSIGMGKGAKSNKGSVKYGEAKAFTDGVGVLVEWETQTELNNLGFYVYRISGGSTERLNKGIVSGSYLRGNTRGDGSKYTYFDADGDLSSVYYVQSLEINGRTVASQTVAPQSIEDLASITGISSAELSKSAKSANPVFLKSETELPEDLQAEVAENAPQADVVVQRWVASQPGARIGIKKEGFYRVSRAELQTAGFDVNSSTALWQLYVNGIQQSINVAADGSFIEFYGRGIDTIDADTQIYYLLVGTENGKRIKTTASRSIGGQVLSQNFAQSLTKKERLNYAGAIINGDAENFFGQFIGGPTTIDFNLPAVDLTVANSSVDIALQALFYGNHQVKVVINGQDIATFSGSFSDNQTRRYNIPTAYLRSGANTLQLTPLTQGSITMFDSIKVNYARQYKAEQNQLSFYTTNYRGNYVGNFSSPNIRVFDITYPENPAVYTGLSAEQNNGSYRVYLPPNRGRVMYAIEDSAILAAASVTQNTPSTLSTAAHNVDLIIVTYKDWSAQANDWADYRRSLGMKVEVVNVEDIFDEFNFGAASSSSLRSFFQFAKTNWQTAPGYVLLMGDATYDPRNYRGNVNSNFIPTKQFDTAGEGEASSDDVLVDFNNDGLAEMAIGRLPVRNSGAVTQLLNKAKTFELTSSAGFSDKSRGVLFASDEPRGWDFAGTSAKLRNLLPAEATGVLVTRIPSDLNVRANLLNELNTGRFFVNYAGHGARSFWAASNFFGKDDAKNLTNSNKLSVFTMLSCLNGDFTDPGDALSESLAESLLKAPNGAVAAWASSGSTTPDVQEIMATRFYGQLALGKITRLGDLVNDSKTVINAGRDVRLSWVLFGDPTLKVR